MDVYPDYLCDATFTALKYGPTDKYLLDTFKESEKIIPVQSTDFNRSLEPVQIENIQLFLKNLLSQANTIDDFTLMNNTRTHYAWLDVYQDGQENHMSNQAIIDEHIQRLNLNV